jgi:hypothetical protein
MAWGMRHVRLVLALLLAGTLAAVGLLGADAWKRVQDSTLEVTGDPSRVYSAPPRLTVAMPLERDELVALLTALDFRPGDGVEPGTYRAEAGAVIARLRSNRTVEVRLAHGAVKALTLDGKATDALEFEPVLLATWLGPAMIGHERVALGQVPPHVVHAVLAAEDAGFFQHPGVSPRSIARAAWTNLRAAERARAAARSRSSWSRTSTSIPGGRLGARRARPRSRSRSRSRTTSARSSRRISTRSTSGTTGRCRWSGSGRRRVAGSTRRPSG